ncbi:MAG: twin-arginine translocation signal domain-containing protein [Actinobacteria bacterium]|nr:twin-arginine translocation signal domain-containing protein [Actinomycetota bacterium]
MSAPPDPINARLPSSAYTSGANHNRREFLKGTSALAVGAACLPFLSIG